MIFAGQTLDTRPAGLMGRRGVERDGWSSCSQEGGGGSWQF